jgi:hypothetical protein
MNLNIIYKSLSLCMCMCNTNTHTHTHTHTHQLCDNSRAKIIRGLVEDEKKKFKSDEKRKTFTSPPVLVSVALEEGVCVCVCVCVCTFNIAACPYQRRA